MPSALTWLDTSTEEQRRVREMISLFTQAESRDELGVGQIRDAFSDTLFPGTSVIQTRARYFLFVPWSFRAGERKGKAGAELLAWANKQERLLVATFKAANVTEGLFGSRAGVDLKVLPSRIYWPALERYGILLRETDQARISVPSRSLFAEADELAERRFGTWHPTMPDPPDGFPNDVPGFFELRQEEASWLAERVMDRTAGSLLAQLLVAQAQPAPDTLGPWEDPAIRHADRSTCDVVEQARLFSLAIHGAALLYNLLLAERYDEEGFNRITGQVDRYRAELEAWELEIALSGDALSTWDRHAFWDWLQGHSTPILFPTRTFVNEWLNVACTGAIGVADDARLRTMIATRERHKKGPQSRLTNMKLLANWAGASGASRLVYRWPQVRRFLGDVLNPGED